jgi:hypothetical protein
VFPLLLTYARAELGEVAMSGKDSGVAGNCSEWVHTTAIFLLPLDVPIEGNASMPAVLLQTRSQRNIFLLSFFISDFVATRHSAVFAWARFALNLRHSSLHGPLMRAVNC